MTKLWKLISAAVLACVPLCASAQYPPGGPADIAGTFYASNFAGWTIAQGNNGPFAWSSSAVCLKASSGGVGFQPFVVGSPIRIVDTASPSHSENVTVTAVRVNGSGCAITTTTPTYQHLSFYLTSATGGLQEAINFSKQNYGVSPSLGVAIATADWERLGGTTAMIVGAAGGSNVSILDLRTSCPVAYTWNGSVYVGINLCNGGGGGTTTLTLTTTGTSGPSTLTGDPTVGYALNVPNYATGGGSGPELQVNGVDTFSQTLHDLDQGPNITITNTSGGHVLISGLPGASIMPQIVPPIGGQYVVLYPSTGTLTNDEGPGRSSISSTSGNFVWTCSGIFCTIAPLTTANWSGFALPSYVNPANVTAIYADAITSAQAQLGQMPFSGANGTSFICGVGGPQLLPPNTGNQWLAVESTKLLSIPATSIASLTCPITLGASGSGDSGEIINVSAIRLIVYYTGTAPPVDSRVQIVPPLTFNADLNQLAIDPLGVGYLQPLTVLTLPSAASASGRIFQITDGTSSSDCTTGRGSTPNLCRSDGTTWLIFSSGGGGGGGLSGQTTGYLPLATSATASTTSSALQDTGSSLVYHGTGTAHGVTLPEGTAISALAGSDILYADATAHCIQYSANGGAFACLGSGGGGTPGGANTQIQFNDSGAFAGDADFLWNKTTKVLTLSTPTRIEAGDNPDTFANFNFNRYPTTPLDPGGTNNLEAFLFSTYTADCAGCHDYGLNAFSGAGGSHVIHHVVGLESTGAMFGSAGAFETAGAQIVGAVHSTGAVTTLEGASFVVFNDAAGTVGESDAINVLVPTNTGGGSLGTQYGIHIHPQLGTNLYSEGVSSTNLFDGKVTAGSIVDSGLTAGTSPICPNGTGGALTTVGCTGGAATTVASSETVTFSATPTFSTATTVSEITMTASITSFTMAAGTAGQFKILTFCQDATGGRTVSGVPANVRGFFTPGATASLCSTQTYHYSTAQTAWLSNDTGRINE